METIHRGISRTKLILRIAIALLSVLLVGLVAMFLFINVKSGRTVIAGSNDKYIFRINIEGGGAVDSYPLSYDSNNNKVKGTVPSAVTKDNVYYYLNYAEYKKGELVNVTLNAGSYTAWAAFGAAYPGGPFRIQYYDVTYKKARYTISYDGNGNGVTNVPSSQEKIFGENLTLSTQKPNRSGYIFLGWKGPVSFYGPTIDGSGATGEKIYKPGEIYSLNQDATFVAQWERKQYRLSFHGNKPSGATGTVTNMPANITVGAGETVTIPNTIPTLDGYVFRGFWWDDNWSEYKPGDKITMNNYVNLRAAWYKQCKLTFQCNNASYGTVDRSSLTNIPAGSLVETNDNVLTITNALTNEVTAVTATPKAKSGNYAYRFVCWKDAGGNIVERYGAYVNETFTAVFERVEIRTIQFIASPSYGYFKIGGETKSSIDVSVNSMISVVSGNKINIYDYASKSNILVVATPNAGTYECSYSFSSWGSYPEMVQSGSQPITIYAYFNRNERFCISYSANGGTGGFTTGYKAKNESFTIINPLNEGFRKTATVTFVSNIEGLHGFTRIIDLTIKTPQWNTEPDGTGTAYKAGDTIRNKVGMVNLYCQWNEEFTLSNDEIPSYSANELPEGVEFRSWYYIDTYNVFQTLTDATVCQDNQKFYARWKGFITYYTNDGTENDIFETQEQTCGERVTITNNKPTREGYKFLGWAGYRGADEPVYLPGASNWVFDEATPELYGVWEEYREYLIKFMPNHTPSSGAVDSQVYTENHYATISNSKLIRYNYIFKGWSEDKYAETPQYTGGEYVEFFKDTNLYAVWEAENRIIYDLTDCIDESGKIPTSPQYTHTPEHIYTIVAETPTRAGAYFQYWQGDNGKQYYPSTEYRFEPKPTEIVLTPVFADYLRVEYLANNGTDDTDLSEVKYNGSVTIKSNIWQSSYTITFVDGVGGTSTENRQVPRAAKGYWTQTPEDTDDESNQVLGDSVIEHLTQSMVLYGQYVDLVSINNLPSLEHDYYKFIGWSTEDGTLVVGSIDIDKDITLYATWAATLTVGYGVTDGAGVIVTKNGAEVGESVGEIFTLTIGSKVNKVDKTDKNTGMTTTLTFTDYEGNEVVIVYSLPKSTFNNGYYLDFRFNGGGPVLGTEEETIDVNTNVTVRCVEKSYTITVEDEE